MRLWHSVLYAERTLQNGALLNVEMNLVVLVHFDNHMHESNSIKMKQWSTNIYNLTVDVVVLAKHFWLDGVKGTPIRGNFGVESIYRAPSHNLNGIRLCASL